MKKVFFSLLLTILATPVFANDPVSSISTTLDKAAWQAEWAAADKDGDGKLNHEEIVIINPRAAEIFDEIDANADGYITPEEDKAALVRGHKKSEVVAD